MTDDRTHTMTEDTFWEKIEEVTESMYKALTDKIEAHESSWEDICYMAAENMVWGNIMVDDNGSTVHYDIFDQEALDIYGASLESIITE